MQQRFGPFHVFEPLGRGGAGSVFRARHEELGREVALKLLHGNLTEDRRQRFAREGVALARVRHPHVVRVYEAGEVVGVELAVDEVEAPGLGALRQGRKGDLRSIGAVGEHRLAEEGAA